MVCEETPEPYAYGARSKPKERFLAGIVSPASPNYMYGLVDVPSAVPLVAPPPLLGIAASVAGYKVGGKKYLGSCVFCDIDVCDMWEKMPQKSGTPYFLSRSAVKISPCTVTWVVCRLVHEPEARMFLKSELGSAMDHAMTWRGLRMMDAAVTGC